MKSQVSSLLTAAWRRRILDLSAALPGPSIPDLIIAATAAMAGLTVLDVGKGFDSIAGITGQPLERLNAS
ncbi:MAG TPA: hypothetical protein VLM11_12705 [Streptosporangiaceae bacterium]|nr:hypothetical protein [Streptosporangiaceae bacterium]